MGIIRAPATLPNKIVIMTGTGDSFVEETLKKLMMEHLSHGLALQGVP